MRLVRRLLIGVLVVSLFLFSSSVIVFADEPVRPSFLSYYLFLADSLKGEYDGDMFSMASARYDELVTVWLHDVLTGVKYHKQGLEMTYITLAFDEDVLAHKDKLPYIIGGFIASADLYGTDGLPYGDSPLKIWELGENITEKLRKIVDSSILIETELGSYADCSTDFLFGDYAYSFSDDRYNPNYAISFTLSITYQGNE